VEGSIGRGYFNGASFLQILLTSILLSAKAADITMHCDGAAVGNHVETLVDIPFKLQLRRNLVTTKVFIGRTRIYKYTATCDDIDGNQFTEGNLKALKTSSA